MSEQKISLSNPQTAPSDAIPSEAVALPSEGRLYPPGHPLHQQQFIEIRPMTARDEDILTSRALFKSGKVIDTLLRSCIVTKGLDVGSMLTGDRNAAIIGIRVSGYGREYDARIECAVCSDKTDIVVDLGELPLKKLPKDVEPVNPFTNEFAFKLPVSGRMVTFKLPNGTDENEFSQLLSRTSKVGMENMVTNRLMMQVVSIDGETDRTKLSGLVRNMVARDSRELRAYMDSINPDVSIVSRFECPTCGEVAEEVDVPLGTQFFWPKARG